jgi:hypothetical protein
MLKILFLSDLHVFASAGREADERPSYVDATDQNPTPTQDAFMALRSLIAQEKIEADLLICGGDLCDKADPIGVRYAWQCVSEVGKLAQVSKTLAVCGNHDLDSRYLLNDDDPDPKGSLQALLPIFPIDDEAMADKYWSRNFVTLQGPKPSTRILLLNSSAYHGGKPAEIKHGRVTARTLDHMRIVLTNEGKRDLNILVCHHHPFPDSRLDGKADYEAIDNGQALLQLLDEPTFGPWLILHGHRHLARIIFAPGAVSQNVVIGAASFSAKISEAANQVHLIDVGVNASYPIFGKIRSWTFSYGQGFLSLPQNKNALPSHCGFGFKGSMGDLATRVHAYVDSASDAYCLWGAVCTAVPDIDYLNPEQFRFFKQELKQRGLRISFGDSGLPDQVIGENA